MALSRAGSRAKLAIYAVPTLCAVQHALWVAGAISTAPNEPSAAFSVQADDLASFGINCWHRNTNIAASKAGAADKASEFATVRTILAPNKRSHAAATTRVVPFVWVAERKAPT